MQLGEGEPRAGHKGKIHQIAIFNCLFGENWPGRQGIIELGTWDSLWRENHSWRQMPTQRGKKENGLFRKLPIVKYVKYVLSAHYKGRDWAD